MSVFENQHDHTVPGAAVSEEIGAVRAYRGGLRAVNNEGSMHRTYGNISAHSSEIFALGREFSRDGSVAGSVSRVIPGRYPCHFPEKSHVELMFVPEKVYLKTDK